MGREKVELFRDLFKKDDRVLVAYSGGVDSSLLLYLLAAETTTTVFAVTIKTPYIPQWEVDEAVAICKSLEINHKVITLPIPETVITNPPERCYLCKKILFSKITEYASELNCNIIADGTNADDTGDHRPGIKALGELNILSPLLESGFTKNEIRSLLREYNSDIWNKPAYACLLTRIPHDTLVDSGMLRTIEKAERFIHMLGYPGTRVRLHNDLARIECPPLLLDKIFSPEAREEIIKYTKSLGIKYVTLDLEGYRTGSLNKPGKPVSQ
ncbi:MAG: ATP-dependent sacrificial sulfur transferase LarE [Bacteroidia bacterium]|nr:MAG: ATP-dependent sacrificial sulfur transferase LarE [Bacteroidia bacterium]